MCGIVGVWHLDGASVDRDEFGRFSGSLRHRGPDGSGAFFDDAVSLALGTNRLGIVDPGSRGDQPISYLNGRFRITYNGEVFNFIEIRDDLRRHGHSFESETDTEVVLAAYAHWGPDCLHRFNGMWSLAIWDTAEKTLFLSRDRFGVKPLYTYHDGRDFAFASEVKAFLALKRLDTSVSAEFLGQSLATGGYLQSGAGTLLRKVRRFPPGHSMTIRRGSVPALTRWWKTLDHLPEIPSDFEAQVGSFRDLFDDACRQRLPVDGPVGVSLSGGLDSTSVLATVHGLCAGHEAGQERASSTSRLAAYMAVSDDPAQDERANAEALIRQLDVPIIHERADPDIASHTLDTMLWHAEDANSIHFGNWAVYEAMRRDGIRVALTGDGSDELLVAYQWQIEAGLEEARRLEGPGSRINEIRSIQRSMLPNRFNEKVLSAVLRATGGEPIGFRNPGSEGGLRGSDLLTLPLAPTGYAAFEEDVARVPTDSTLRRRLYFDFHYGILPWILSLKDASSMAHGVEVRSPFMDWRVVCFALALPGPSVLGGGFTKRILRQAMAGRLPDAIRTRPSKISFVDSESRLFWRMKPVVLETTSTRSFLESELWNGPQLRDQIQRAYENGGTETSAFFWKCVKTARLLSTFAAGRHLNDGSA